MNTQSNILYLVDPESARVMRWLRQAGATAVYLYWELLVCLPVAIFTRIFAAVIFLAAIIDLIHRPSDFARDLPLAAVALAALVIPRAREFLWVLLGCFVVWMVVVVAALLPILGADYKATTTFVKVLLGVVYLLPPGFAAFYVDRVRHRKT